MSVEASRCSGTLGEAVLVVILSCRMVAFFNGVARPAELEDRSGKGMTYASRKFFGRMPIAIREYPKQLFRLRGRGAQSESTLVKHMRGEMRKLRVWDEVSVRVIWSRHR